MPGIVLTNAAARKVQELILEEHNPDLKLRVYISGGGCSGFQYGMALEPFPNADDTVLEIGEIKVFVDPMSVPMLDGVVVDFLDNLDGSGFKFDNPNATKSCGCGNSFSC